MISLLTETTTSKSIQKLSACSDLAIASKFIGNIIWHDVAKVANRDFRIKRRCIPGLNTWSLCNWLCCTSWNQTKYRETPQLPRAEHGCSKVTCESVTREDTKHVMMSVGQRHLVHSAVAKLYQTKDKSTSYTTRRKKLIFLQFHVSSFV